MEVSSIQENGTKSYKIMFLKKKKQHFVQFSNKMTDS